MSGLSGIGDTLEKLKIEANASKRGQRALVHYAEREHFRAAEGWSIEN